jgi:hypothetical protein
MQVSSKVTDLATLTAAELADIGNYLSGVGAAALALIVFFCVYRWRVKPTDKGDTLDSTTEKHKGL